MQATAFFQSINAIPVDVRYGGMPVAIAADLMGSKPKRSKLPKKSWEECQAMAKILNVTLGRDSIQFAGLSFENGKRYSYKNATQCHEALLSLHRDRLSRMSDEELQSASAIAAGEIL